jgi:hypothetical protein
MASAFDQEHLCPSPAESSTPASSPSPSLSASSPRSALKGSRGSKLDRLRWDEEHLQALEKEQSSRRRKAKRAGFLLPLVALLALVLYYAFFVRWRT